MSIDNSIKIEYHRGMPSNSIKQLQTQLQKLCPVTTTIAREHGRYNAWEWIIPATVALFVGKSVLDGFLQEIGSEGARKLKEAMGRVFTSSKKTNLRIVSVYDIDSFFSTMRSMSKREWARYKKTNPPGNPKSVLSIDVELPESETNVRFVFPYELDKVMFVTALQQLPTIVAMLIADPPYLHETVFVYLRSSHSWVNADTLDNSDAVEIITPNASEKTKQERKSARRRK